MPNVHTTLTSLFTAIANAIRGKTGSSSQIVADDFPSAIDAIPTGTPLPPLTDPASASDILNGKEVILPDANDEPTVVTGTFVPPVDTGANGLYKSALESAVTELVDEGLTALRAYAQYANPSLVKVSLPNLTSVGTNAFSSCSNLTGIVDLGSAVCGAVIFKSALRRTSVIKLGTGNQTLASLTAVHVWFPNGYTRVANYEYNQAKWLKTVQYDDMKNSFSLVMCGGVAALEAFVIRKSTLISLTGNGLAGYDSSVFRFYVPASLLNDYKIATNWTAYASLMVGIDEDTACTTGDIFTPTTTATGIDHWDIVPLQSYTTYSAFDSTTGAVTTSHDGRLLIRGLDANDNIVHVTYLQIGTGIDEEQNLLENL